MPCVIFLWSVLWRSLQSLSELRPSSCIVCIISNKTPLLQNSNYITREYKKYGPSCILRACVSVNQYSYCATYYGTHENRQDFRAYRYMGTILNDHKYTKISDKKRETLQLGIAFFKLLLLLRGKATLSLYVFKS